MIDDNDYGIVNLKTPPKNYNYLNCKVRIRVKVSDVILVSNSFFVKKYNFKKQYTMLTNRYDKLLFKALNI